MTMTIRMLKKRSFPAPGLWLGLALAIALGALPEARGVAYWTGVNGGYWSNGAGTNWSSTAASPGTPYIPVNGDILEWRGAFGINKVSTNDLNSLTTVGGINMNNGSPSGVVLNGTNKLTLTGNINAGSSGSNTVNLPLELNVASLFLTGATGSGILILNGDITETGGSRILNIVSGTAALYGSNSFSGNMIVGSSGMGTWYINTLASTNLNQSLGKGGLIQFGHNDGTYGTLIYNGNGGSTDRRFQISRAGSYKGTGSFVNNGSGAVTWAGLQTKTGNTNTLAFTLGGTNTDDNTWQSVIDNNSAAGLIGITKIDSGKWILSGANLYDGPTTVSNGTLLVNGNQSGATGHVFVAGGAYLGGTGTVGGAVSVSSNAALSPGSAGVGTFTVNGAVTLAEGAAYAWQCQDGNGDLVDVNGTLTLPAAATVTVSQLSGSLPAVMTLFTADALAGAADLSGWTVSGLSGGRAQIQGSHVILKMGFNGTVIAIR